MQDNLYTADDYTADDIFRHLLPLLGDEPDLTPLSDSNYWMRVQNMARRGGVAPLLAFRLWQHPQAQQAQTQLAWCNRVLSRSFLAHQRSLEELESVVSSFAAEGIDVIPLKGPFLAERHYRPAFTRKPAGDLDVLVRNEDLNRAVASLAKQGFVATGSITEARATHYHVVMTHESKISVEIHFRLGHGARRFKAKQFFERAVEAVTPGGTKVMLLAPPDELLHLALHLVSDRFRKLSHFVELRTLWTNARPEWREEAVNRALEGRFIAVLTLLDAAFRSRWNEPFIPAGMSLPRVWMRQQIDANFYKALEDWRTEKSISTLGERLHGRWLEIQLTDTVADALGACWQTGRVAWSGIKHRRWGRILHGQSAGGEQVVANPRCIGYPESRPVRCESG